MAQTTPPPGWYRDPTGTADNRYWDGRAWTDAVTRTGETTRVPIDPEQAAVPPLPGTEARSMVAPTPYLTVDQRRISPVLVVLLLLVIVLTVVVIIVVADTGGTSDDQPANTQPPTTEGPAEGG